MNNFPPALRDQAGLEGLHEGLRRYDPSRGTRLGTCLYFSVRDCITKEFRRHNRVVAIPGTAQRQHLELQRAMISFVDAHNRRDPSLLPVGLSCLHIMFLVRCCVTCEARCDEVQKLLGIAVGSVLLVCTASFNVPLFLHARDLGSLAAAGMRCDSD